MSALALGRNTEVIVTSGPFALMFSLPKYASLSNASVTPGDSMGRAAAGLCGSTHVHFENAHVHSLIRFKTFRDQWPLKLQVYGIGKENWIEAGVSGGSTCGDLHCLSSRHTRRKVEPTTHPAATGATAYS